MANATPEYLDTKQAARLMGFSYKTLENWRSKGEGPKFLTLPNKRVRYRREDIDEWVEKPGADPTMH